MSTLMQNSFNAGEITKRLGGRVDLAKYVSALETCFNALPQPHGGVARRTGTQFIAACKNANKLARVLSFEYSTDQAYVIEAGDLYNRFFMDGGQIQAFDAYTKLCMHPTGVNASNVFTDAATSKTITTSGNVVVDTSTSPFSTGVCARFPGAASDYISLIDSADWNMGSAVATVDFWVRFNTLPSSGTQGFFCQSTDADNGIQMNVVNDRVFFTIEAATVSTNMIGVAADLSLLTNTWYHMAIIRGWGGNVNDWAFTLNGYVRRMETHADAWPDLTGVFEIGRDRTPNYLDGQIAEFRVSKGIARWTANFTPPSVPYPLSAGGSAYEIVTTYTQDQLAAIKYCQSADVMYLAHPDHVPAKLTRTGHAAWTITNITFAWPPFADQNATTITLNPDATAVGGVNLVASGGLFDTNWQGNDIKIATGYLNIVTVSTNTQCAGNIINELTPSGGSDLAATLEWSRCAWNADSGYPRCVVFFEERLCFAANSAQPQTDWMSVSGDYENFNAMEGATIADTDACTFTISSDQVNAIRWLSPTKKLVHGTTGGEWLLYGPNEGGITPSNIKRDEETAYGAQDIQPVRIGNKVMFLQRGGKKLRELGYDYKDDAYVATDLTILAEHLTRNNTIVDMAFQKRPNQVLWCVRNDGDLIALTYLKEHDVVGWSHHDVGGDVESVATIPGASDDEVWLIVKRVINGETVRYVERLKQDWDGDDVSDAFYVDCGLTYSGAAVNVITGLSHLNGCYVNILADGVPHTATTISGYSIILANSATAEKVHVGIPITTHIKTLRLGPVNIQGKIKRISAVVARFFETAGNVLLGSSPSDADTTALGNTPITRDETITNPAGYDTDCQVFISKVDPMPLTILSITPDLEEFDEIDRI